jgi:hypothetical protein
MVVPIGEYRKGAGNRAFFVAPRFSPRLTGSGGLTLEKKYQIFVSSTFRDLVEERQDTIKSILDLGHIPAGMEGFPAIDMEQLKYIKKVIDQCDYYILIVAGRYGSVDADGVSFTEKEYQYAVETGKAVLAFVLENPDKLPVDKADLDPSTITRLDAFRTHVMSGRIVRHWKDRDSLKYAVFTSLVSAFNELPSVGWIRANTAASEDLLNQINALRMRNDELEEANARLKSEMTPMINDLASLDSTFPVYYTYTRRLHGIATDVTSHVTMAWRAIFVAIGPELVRAQSPFSNFYASQNVYSGKTSRRAKISRNPECNGEPN